MFIVEYDARYGMAYPDAVILETASYHLNQYKYCDTEYRVKVSNSAMVDAFKLLVKRGAIDYNKIVFEFEGLTIRVDKNGNLECYPKGFCDDSLEIVMELAWGDGK